MSNIHIIHETVFHQKARDLLINDCFSAPQSTRAAYILRQGVDPIAAYSSVALQEDVLVGSIRFTPMLLPNKAEILMLGPLAIAPLMRGRRIGKSLVKRGLQQLQDGGHAGVIVIGDAGYFTALGFNVALTQNLTLPGIVTPLTLLGIEWQKGFLTDQQGMVCHYFQHQ